MGGIGELRWGITRGGQRHAVYTNARYLGQPGVTPVSWCGIDLERLGETPIPWDESCERCNTAWSGR
jgi:hypothetical protein